MATNKSVKKPAREKRENRPVYERNEKHRDPWQRGRKGSLCKKETVAQAQALLDKSVAEGTHRFATDGERAFRGAEHAPRCWHGWPVGWKEVPEPLRRAWIQRGVVKRSYIRLYWHDHLGQP